MCYMGPFWTVYGGLWRLLDVSRVNDAQAGDNCRRAGHAGRWLLVAENRLPGWRFVQMRSVIGLGIASCQCWLDASGRVTPAPYSAIMPVHSHR